MSNGSLACAPDVLEGIGRRLKALRIGCHMTPSMAANALGLHRQAVNAYERGDAAPSAEGLRRLARLYRTTTDYILFGGAADRRAC